jgi:lactoylglutathione lyase
MIKKVEHVALIVTNMEKSIEYYSEMFGFKLRARGENKTNYIDQENGV